jgi:hypothetical protein
MSIISEIITPNPVLQHENFSLTLHRPKRKMRQNCNSEHGFLNVGKFIKKYLIIQKIKKGEKIDGP